MMFAWLIAQLVFWVVAMSLTVAAFAVVAVAPPYFAGRYVWHRCR